MLEITVLCSEEACAEELVLHVADLAELEQHLCGCGCAWVVLDVSEVELV
jgi:hypothetical protein